MTRRFNPYSLIAQPEFPPDFNGRMVPIGATVHERGWPHLPFTVNDGVLVGLPFEALCVARVLEMLSANEGRVPGPPADRLRR